MFSKTSFLILPFLMTFLLFSAVNADAAASEPVFDDLMDLIVYKNNLNLKGDVNSDYVVDEADLMEIGELYGDISTPEEPQAADLNTDGKVDIYDFGTTGINYGGKLFSTNAAKGGSSTMYIDPSYQMVEPDDVFNLYVKITTTDSIFAISTVISYNKTLVNATGVSEGGFLGGDGKKTYPIMSIDWENGIVYYDSTRYDTQTGISGSGTLLEVTFKALQEGMTPIDIITYELVDVNLTSLTGITIENGTVEVNINDPAEIDPISDQNVDEGQVLSFTVNATDPEGDSYNLTVIAGPGSMTGNMYSYTPGWDTNHDNEVHAVTIESEDEHGAKDTESFQLTVNDINRAPTIDSITDKQVDEGQTLSFTVSGSDPDTDTLTYSVKSGPGSITGTTYSYSPGWDSNHDDEVSTVTVEVSDGHGGTDETSFQLTVNDVNRDPIVTTIPDKNVDEGQTLSFAVSGTDPESDTLTYSVKSGPGSITGTAYSYSPGWDTNHDNEVYTVTVEANDGHGGTDTEAFQVTVNDVNRDPTINTITDKQVDEGQTLSFSVSGSDPESDTLSFSVTSGPGSITGTTYSYSPGWDTNHDDEVSSVTIEATDGHGGSDTEGFQLTVSDVNRAPSIYDYYPTDLTPEMDEGTSLGFNISVSDPESDTISYSWELDGLEVSTASTYVYSPGYADSGEHEVVVTVSDGSLIDDWGWTVTVNDVTITCTQNSECGTDGYITDPFCSGLDVVKTYRTYTCNNPGTPSAYCSSADSDITQETCSYVCSDGSCISNEDPVIDPISDQSVNEGQTLSFTVNVTDTYGDTVTLSVKSGLGSITGTTYSYSPGWDSNHDNEVSTVTIEADDGNGGTDTESFDITVTDINRAPTIDSYTPTDTTPSVDEGSSLAFSVSASDAESDTLTYSWKLDGDEVSTSTSYTYYPFYTDSGTHTVQVTVSDGSLTDTQSWTVTVNNVNLAPVIAEISDKNVNEGQTLSFSVTAADPDNDIVTLSVNSGPGSMTDDTYSYSPGWDADHDNEVYTVTILASDGNGGTTTESFDITVTDVNRAPSIDSYLPSSLTPDVDEGSIMVFNVVSASDPDGDSLSYSWELDGTEVSTASSYTHSTGYTDAGTYTIEVTVSDDHGGTDSLTWTLTVNDLDTVSIPLSAGQNNDVWLPARPVDTAIEAVLASIAGKYNSVMVYDPSIYCDESVWCEGLTTEECESVCEGKRWLSYDPARPPSLNTLHELDETLPFNIYMWEAATLVVDII